MKGKWMKIVRQYTIITLGISMMAVGVYFFKFPNNFVFGGVTGAAALAAKLTPISASEFSAVVNMLMLLLGLIFLGKEFALTTGYATVVLSAELMLLEKACPLNEPLSDQPMLELIFAIALPAIASALLFSVGASSGGTDVIALIVEKYTIYTTLTRHEAMQLREFIHKEHLNAFMSMLSTTEVFGKGFDNA